VTLIITPIFLLPPYFNFPYRASALKVKKLAINVQKRVYTRRLDAKYYIYE